VNAAENAFADRSMMLGENDQLFGQNYEKEVSTSTRTKTVGSARVMKYEETLKEQGQREKELGKKVTRGRARPRKKQIEPTQQKQTSKQGKGNERALVSREITELDFEEYCSVIEF